MEQSRFNFSSFSKVIRYESYSLFLYISLRAVKIGESFNRISLDFTSAKPTNVLFFVISASMSEALVVSVAITAQFNAASILSWHDNWVPM